MAAGKYRNTRRAVNKPFVAFVLALLLAGGIIGGAVVSVANAIAAKTEESEEPSAGAPYGTRDGKAIQGEPPYEYLSNSDFAPLDCGLSEELQEYTYYLCEAYYIDFEFAMALMYTESSFNTDAISKTGDYGLMQINQCNHESLSSALGISDFTEPYGNIRAGLFILRGLFEKYDDAAKVCMAYNMGEYGASVLWQQGIYETSYSNKILAKADEYAAQRGAAADE